MKIKNLSVYGIKESILRSGYPMQVGEPKDMYLDYESYLHYGLDAAKSNDGDNKRAIKLSNTSIGSGHNNFLKGIVVQFDLQYPEYFSPQLQRYHWVDIVSSQSKMHKLSSRLLTSEDFTYGTSQRVIDIVNEYIELNNESNGNKFFEEIISNLPSGYLKWMGISTNYLQLKTIYFQRRNHKLAEWKEFCEFIETLPMSELITGNYGKEEVTNN